MPITVTRDGSTMILSMRTAIRHLPDDYDIGLLLTDLGYGDAVPVTLKDGSRALYTITASSEMQPDPGNNWPLPTSPAKVALRRPFNAHCKALLELDVHVQCTALDEVHAEQLIRSVFLGERQAPADFRTIFDREETQDFMLRLKSVFEDGDLASADVRDVLVTGFAEPMQALNYQGE